MLFDLHTHHLDAPAGQAVLSLSKEALRSSEAFSLSSNSLYSVGVHPWWTTTETEVIWERVQHWAGHRQVVMIGEVGLDKLQGDWEKQQSLLRLHIALSEQVQKPLLLHCVRAFNELIALRRRLRPTQPWVVHGFRSKPTLARPLLAAGFHLSFGAHFHPESLALCPPDRLHIETDDSHLSIEEIFHLLLPHYPTLTPSLLRNNAEELLQREL